MKLEDKDKVALIKRELEIRRLVRQMELDRLSSSTVCKNLEYELRTIKHKLMMHNASI